MTRNLMLFVVLLFAGCSGTPASVGIKMADARISRDAPASKPAAIRVPQAKAEALDNLQPIAADLTPPVAPEIARMVVHTATIDLVVAKLSETQAAVERIIDEAKGYIAKSDIAGSSGGNRHATWTLKVPVTRYRDTLGQLAALGSLVKQTADSQDVTEEFYDLGARVKSLKAEEEVLQKLLKEAVARLDEILKIREQIKLVRLDIDRAEGRMKFLGSRAELSTITVSAREDEKYVAPPVTPVAAPPTYSTEVAGTFSRSTDSLFAIGKGLGLIVVAVAPWLPFALVGGLLLRWGLRWAARPNPRPVAAK